MYPFSSENEEASGYCGSRCFFLQKTIGNIGQSCGKDLVKILYLPMKKAPRRELLLRLLDKFFPTFWAGDGNLPLALGHPHQLTALGAVKVPVIPILKPIQQQ